MEPSYYETYYRQETRHWWFRWRYDLMSRVIEDLDDGVSDPLMLDAGCGTGQMLKHLQRYGTAIGLDVSESALAFAASRGAHNLVLGSVEHPPFRPGTFDRIFVLDVIEHIDDDLGMLRNLRDLLRPGGVLVATVPAFQTLWTDHDRINRHKRRYVVPQVEALLVEAGYEVRRVSYCNALFFPLAYPARRLMSLRDHVRPTSPADLKSALRENPAWLNEVMFRLLKAENRLTRRWNPPAGVSILAIAIRPDEPGS